MLIDEQTLKNVRDTSLSSLELHSPELEVKAQHTKFDWRRNINAFQRLKNLSTLDGNWDGYGAGKFTKQQIRRALDIYADLYTYFVTRDLSFSQFSPFIAPCSDGSILFEWGGNRFPDCQLEILVPSSLSDPCEYLKSDHSGDQEGAFIELSFSSELLGWLLKDKI